MSAPAPATLDALHRAMTPEQRVEAQDLISDCGLPEAEAYSRVWARRGSPARPAHLVSIAQPAPTQRARDRSARRAADAVAPAEPHSDAAAPELLPVTDPVVWEGLPTPLRKWTLRDWLLASSATLLSGAGSSGKSLWAQQLCTHAALGQTFLGVAVSATAALYVTCEDDIEELQRRQEAICEGLNASFADLSGKLHLVSLAGVIGNELCTFDVQGRMTTTPAWDRLLATVLSLKVGLVVLDNVAHLFAGDENNRHQVASFCGLMNRLAAEAQAAVLFIGHPNKAGASYSGSTAWENQVRSRLFLERPTGEEGEVLDSDARVLRREKANYARNGEEIAFRWYRGAFVRPEDMPRGEVDAIEATARLRAEEERFLACLVKTAAERRATSPNPSASNYAPRVFAAMPTAKGMALSTFAAAMQRLLDTGAIRNGERVYQRDNRAWVTGLAAAPTLAPTPHKAVHEAAPTPSETP